ncbi:hypothetical protein Tco_1417508 [Tanacetum coccineum]
MPLTLVGGGSLEITPIFALSTSRPALDTLCPRSIGKVNLLRVYYIELEMIQTRSSDVGSCWDLVLLFHERWAYTRNRAKFKLDMITRRKEGSSKNTYSRLLGRGLSSRSVGESDSEFSSAVIAMNSSNSAKSFSSTIVPSFECRILLPSLRRSSKSSSKISSITSILKQFTTPKIELFLLLLKELHRRIWEKVLIRLGELYYLLPFQDNEIYGKDLRVLRDSFAYSEYDMRLMLAPMSARALHEKALLKVHGIRKLPGSPSFGGTLF